MQKSAIVAVGLNLGRAFSQYNIDLGLINHIPYSTSRFAAQTFFQH